MAMVNLLQKIVLDTEGAAVPEMVFYCRRLCLIQKGLRSLRRCTLKAGDACEMAVDGCVSFPSDCLDSVTLWLCQFSV
jgi:hypothetical protein